MVLFYAFSGHDPLYYSLFINLLGDGSFVLRQFLHQGRAHKESAETEQLLNIANKPFYMPMADDVQAYYL